MAKRLIKKAVTVGSFDGVHLGHQYLLKEIRKSLSENTSLQVLTFDPHPQEYLEKRERFLLMETPDKIECLKMSSVDEVNVLRFDDEMRGLSAEGFLKRFVLDQGGVVSLYLGYDFKYGKNKEGGFELAERICQQNSINVFKLPSLDRDGTTISSTKIRELLRNGNCTKANEYLGRSYKLTGKIVRGFGRGRTIGFPTTNIQVSERRLVPQNGVYITSAMINGNEYKSITNVGLNPTFSNSDTVKIESHHFGFNEDIYDRTIEIAFLERIRDERKFNSAVELTKQISLDVKNALEKHEEIRAYW
jgi:riboflavin kinase / FMN adenylyltransferase